MAYIEITNKEQFDKEVIKNDGKVVVDFWAPWCGPCRMFGPIFEKVSKDPAMAKIKFVKINVDEGDGQEIAASLGVSGIPAIFLFQSGKVASQKSGMMMEAQFKQFLG